MTATAAHATVTTEVTPPAAVVTEKSTARVTKTAVSQKLTPSMSFMQSLEEEAMPYYGSETATETVPQNAAAVAVAAPKPTAALSENTPAATSDTPQERREDLTTAAQPLPERQAPTG